MNARTLTVKGSGGLKTPPDLIAINMILTTTSMDYDETNDRAAKDVEAIRNAVVAAGHNSKALKTTNFNIKTEYESIQDRAGNWRQKFKGYTCTHNLKLEFDLDMKRLGETIAAISQSQTTPNFSILFSIKDKTAVETEILKRAVANATEKAAILAKASGVSLVGIKHIDYSWNEVRLYSDTKLSEIGEPVGRTLYSSMDIQPEDVEVNDTVTIIWEIQ